MEDCDMLRVLRDPGVEGFADGAEPLEGGGQLLGPTQLQHTGQVLAHLTLTRQVKHLQEKNKFRHMLYI